MGIKLNTFFSKNSKSNIFIIHAKSQMPKFDEDDEAELANIMNSNQQRITKPISAKKVNNKTNPDIAAPKKTDLKLLSESYTNEFLGQKMPSSSALKASPKLDVPTPQQIPPLVKPNNDWRNVKSDVNPALYSNPTKKSTQTPMKSQTPQKSIQPQDDYDEYFSFTDLDYDDFEQAMREEENGDMGVKASKVSKPVIVHHGLHSGDQIPAALLNNNLLLPDGSKCDLSKLVRPDSEFLLIFSDPRRLTESFRDVLRQFATIPITSSRISLLAVNCDDASDQRKFIKKFNNGNGIPVSNGSPTYSLLTDPTKKVSCYIYIYLLLLCIHNFSILTIHHIFVSFKYIVYVEDKV